MSQIHYHYYVPPQSSKADGCAQGCAGCGCLVMIIFALIVLLGAAAAAAVSF